MGACSARSPAGAWRLHRRVWRPASRRPRQQAPPRRPHGALAASPRCHHQPGHQRSQGPGRAPAASRPPSCSHRLSQAAVQNRTRQLSRKWKRPRRRYSSAFGTQPGPTTSLVESLPPAPRLLPQLRCKPPCSDAHRRCAASGWRAIRAGSVRAMQSVADTFSTASVFANGEEAATGPLTRAAAKRASQHEVRAKTCHGASCAPWGAVLRPTGAASLPGAVGSEPWSPAARRPWITTRGGLHSRTSPTSTRRSSCRRRCAPAASPAGDVSARECGARPHPNCPHCQPPGSPSRPAPQPPDRALAAQSQALAELERLEGGLQLHLQGNPLYGQVSAPRHALLGAPHRAGTRRPPTRAPGRLSCRSRATASSWPPAPRSACARCRRTSTLTWRGRPT